MTAPAEPTSATESAGDPHSALLPRRRRWRRWVNLGILAVLGGPLVATALLDGGGVSTLAIGTGGEACEVATRGDVFQAGDPIRLIATYAPDLPVGTAVTLRLVREGASVPGYPQVLNLDAPTSCISGRLSASPLAPGHYQVEVAPAGRPPIKGGFDITDAPASSS